MSDFIGWVQAIAIVLGPIAAVWVTRWMDQERAERDRRLDTFRTLMKTRRLRLSQEHVAALNLVEIEFYKRADVIAAWKEYQKSLSVILTEANITDKDRQRHFEEQEELLTKLLHAMARTLGFSKIEQLDIMKGGYTPQGWADVESQQNLLRLLLIEMLRGNRPIPITPVINPTATSPYPPPPDEQAQPATVLRTDNVPKKTN
ncbi:MAG: hypothetical protein IPK73_12280 [Candidatus Obscuribacter sp.]|nr:hypothetical protein [Candidatus Obscuribacter sp.]MBK9281798.1 hypothetical protein [Candidatus Obscuribacter sp.]